MRAGPCLDVLAEPEDAQASLDDRLGEVGVTSSVDADTARVREPDHRSYVGRPDEVGWVNTRHDLTLVDTRDTYRYGSC